MNDIIKAIREYFEKAQHTDVVSACVFGSQISGRAHRESGVNDLEPTEQVLRIMCEMEAKR